MYAVIRTGGKQYKVQEDQILRVEKLEGAEGSQVEFDDVLLYSDGETITLETLEQRAIPTPKLLQFARRIKEGEADLAEKETQLAELRAMLGLALTPSSSKPQNSNGSAKKAKTRVGQRNPARDTVGVK